MRTTFLRWGGLCWVAVVALSAGCSQRGPGAGASGTGDACCPPGAAGAGLAEGERAAALCGEHRVLEAECGICGPERLAELRPGQALKVRLPAAESAAQAGLTLVSVEERPAVDAVECPVELAFDPNRLTQVVAPVAGILRGVQGELGVRVAQGQVLAELGSAAIGEAVTRARLSWQTLHRERRLRSQRITPEKDLQQAEAEYRAACEQLRALGFTEAEILQWLDSPEREAVLPLRAPLEGEIIERHAVRGAWVEAGQRLFTLADRSRMVARLSLPEAALSEVCVGQAVELFLEAWPDRVFTGRVCWIAAEVDGRTRRAWALAEFPNPDGLLRAQMFGRARVGLGPARSALWIPEGAVQRVEGRTVVFVFREPDLFEARVVRLGRGYNGRREVLEGVQRGEQVAVAGSFTLKSQLLLSRLGAGCAGD